MNGSIVQAAVAETNQRISMMTEEMQRIFVGMCCGAGVMKAPPFSRLFTKLSRLGMASQEAKNAWWINYMSTHRNTSAATLNQYMKWMNHTTCLLEPKSLDGMLRASRTLTEHLENVQ